MRESTRRKPGQPRTPARKRKPKAAPKSNLGTALKVTGIGTAGVGAGYGAKKLFEKKKGSEKTAATKDKSRSGATSKEKVYGTTPEMVGGGVGMLGGGTLGAVLVPTRGTGRILGGALGASLGSLAGMAGGHYTQSAEERARLKAAREQSMKPPSEGGASFGGGEGELALRVKKRPEGMTPEEASEQYAGDVATRRALISGIGGGLAGAGAGALAGKQLGGPAGLAGGALGGYVLGAGTGMEAGRLSGLERGRELAAQVLPKQAAAFQEALDKLSQPQQQEPSMARSVGKGALIGGGLGAAATGASAGYLRSGTGKKHMREFLRQQPSQRAAMGKVMKSIKTPGGIAKQVAKGAGRMGAIGAGVGLGAYGLSRMMRPKQASAEKTAKKKSKDKPPYKAMALMPAAGAGAGAGIGGLAEAARAAHRPGKLSLKGVPRSALRGGALGAGIGLGTAGLLGAGHLLKDTDPRVLQTAAQLAPAAGMTYAALKDEPKTAMAKLCGLSVEQWDELQKEAVGAGLLAGMKAGLGAAKGFVGKAAPTVRKAFAGGKGQGIQWRKGFQSLGQQAEKGIGAAGRWANVKGNRRAALGLAGAGLGGAALGGAALGRATAPRYR
jgi:hypothetical protein